MSESLSLFLFFLSLSSPLSPCFSVFSAVCVSAGARVRAFLSRLTPALRLALPPLSRLSSPRPRSSSRREDGRFVRRRIKSAVSDIGEEEGVMVAVVVVVVLVMMIMMMIVAKEKGKASSCEEARGCREEIIFSCASE